MLSREWERAEEANRRADEERKRADERIEHLMAQLREERRHSAEMQRAMVAVIIKLARVIAESNRR